MPIPKECLVHWEEQTPIVEMIETGPWPGGFQLSAGHSVIGSNVVQLGEWAACFDVGYGEQTVATAASPTKAVWNSYLNSYLKARTILINQKYPKPEV